MKKNCIVLLVDSLRFDAINAFEPREEGILSKLGLRDNLQTPSFDYFVNNGASIPRLHATFGATPPSTTSLLTGLYPREHGICGFNRPLDEDSRTLADYFKGAGYHTLLMNGIDVFSINGISNRFDEYIHGSPADLIRRISSKNEQDEPVFAFYHTMDVHRPYFLSRYPLTPGVHRFSLKILQKLAEKFDVDPPPTLRDTFCRPENKTARYGAMNTKAWNEMLKMHYHFKDEEIDIADPVTTLADLYVKGVQWFDRNHLKEFVEFLQTDSNHDTVALITADHGESPLMLQGTPTFYHGGKPREDLIKIPGIISGAGLSSSEFNDWSLTSMVDLAPTLLDIMGIDTGENNFSGLNLFESPPDQRFIYSEFSQQMANQEFPRDAVLNWQSIIRSDGLKYYRQALPVEEKDYDLPLKKFVELMVRKLLLSMPDDSFYEQWLSLQEEHSDDEIKQQLVNFLSARSPLKKPELYRWIDDHFENNNLLKKEEGNYQEIGQTLNDLLCERFLDPAHIAWEENEITIDHEEETEVIEGLKGLGYL